MHIIIAFQATRNRSKSQGLRLMQLPDYFDLMWCHSGYVFLKSVSDQLWRVCILHRGLFFLLRGRFQGLWSIEQQHSIQPFVFRSRKQVTTNLIPFHLFAQIITVIDACPKYWIKPWLPISSIRARMSYSGLIQGFRHSGLVSRTEVVFVCNVRILYQKRMSNLASNHNSWEFCRSGFSYLHQGAAQTR